MNKGLNEIKERRQLLVARAAAQRRSLGRSINAWRTPLALADRGVVAMKFVRRNPILLAGTLLLPGALLPRVVQGGRLVKLMRRGYAAWQLVRRLRSGRSLA